MTSSGGGGQMFPTNAGLECKQLDFGTATDDG